jgi:hypothetical protein
MLWSMAILAYLVVQLFHSTSHYRIAWRENPLTDERSMEAQNEARNGDGTQDEQWIGECIQMMDQPPVSGTYLHTDDEHIQHAIGPQIATERPLTDHPLIAIRQNDGSWQYIENPVHNFTVRGITFTGRIVDQASFGGSSVILKSSRQKCPL